MSRKWSAEDTFTLEKLYSSVPKEFLAKELNRTVGAIQARAHVIGCTKPKKTWTEDAEEYLIDAYEAGVSVSEIMMHLGKSECSVRKKVDALGIFRNRKLNY